jgi:hypothetical protein
MESKAIVSKLPHGPIPLSMRDQILRLVETCWDKFEKSGKTKMQVWRIRRDAGPKVGPQIYAFR